MELWGYLPLEKPLDGQQYPQDPRVRRLSPKRRDGRYVYAVDEQGVIWVLMDNAPHLHPKS